MEGNTDYDGIRKAIASAKAEKNKPTLIMVKTVIGYGAPTKANSHDAHGAPLGKAEAEAARKNLGWSQAMTNVFNVGWARRIFIFVCPIFPKHPPLCMLNLSCTLLLHFF